MTNGSSTSISPESQQLETFEKNVSSDEAHFHINGFVNKQYCHIWELQNSREINQKNASSRNNSYSQCCALSEHDNVLFVGDLDMGDL